MPESKPHRLSPPGRVRTPASVICFDTETYWTDTEAGEEHTLRCWDAVWRRRPGPGVAGQWATRHAGEDRGSLARFVSDATEAAKETWLLAHNVSFDIQVSGLVDNLAILGFELTDAAIGDESSFIIMRRAGRRVCIADSWSYFRCSLEAVARDLRRRKRPLPGTGDGMAAWHRRCEKDAALLDQAMAVLMDWWEHNGRGRFGLTSASTGWQLLKATQGARRLVVGGKASTAAFEREAIYGGFKEAYRVGRFAGTVVADYDFASAYPAVAAGRDLPERRLGHYPRLPRPAAIGEVPRLGAIARCIVEADVPCVPARIGEAVCYPTGRFTATLATPDIAYALSLGAKVTIGDGWLYRLGAALREWAADLMELQGGAPAEVPPLVRRVAKGWGRQVVGRFAVRRGELAFTYPATSSGFSLSPGRDLDTGRRYDDMVVGDRVHHIVKDLEGRDSLPATFAFVESYCRVALLTALSSRPARNVLQANTDGWWEKGAVRSRADDLPRAPWPMTLTRKALGREIVIVGPNHVRTPKETRLSGISKDAEEDGDGAFHWRDWPSLRWQLEHSDHGRYVRPERAAHLAATYVHRWVLETGETVPVTLELTEAGENKVLPWPATRHRLSDDVLAGTQVPVLNQANDTFSASPPLGDFTSLTLPGRDPSTPRRMKPRRPTPRPS